MGLDGRTCVRSRTVDGRGAAFPRSKRIAHHANTHREAHTTGLFMVERQWHHMVESIVRANPAKVQQLYPKYACVRIFFFFFLYCALLLFFSLSFLSLFSLSLSLSLPLASCGKKAANRDPTFCIFNCYYWRGGWRHIRYWTNSMMHADVFSNFTYNGTIYQHHPFSGGNTQGSIAMLPESGLLVTSIPFNNSRSNMTVWSSSDSGATWHICSHVYSGYSGYSGIVGLNETHAGLLWEVSATFDPPSGQPFHLAYAVLKVA